MRTLALVLGLAVIASPAFATEKPLPYPVARASATSAPATADAHGYGGAGGAGGSAGSVSNSDSTDVHAYGLAYTDGAIGVPPAALNDSVVVRSQNLKVLGPLFGYAWQSVDKTPNGLLRMSSLAQLALTNDGTYEGQQEQFAIIATICAYEPDLAEQLNFGCK